jgi:hypothetical protein
MENGVTKKASMKEGPTRYSSETLKTKFCECKMQTQKRKQPRHIASEEKIRMLYFSPDSPYIPREPFILHIFNSSSKGEEVLCLGD